MKTVIIKLDRKKKCINAFLFLSIVRVIMEDLAIDEYCNMHINNKEIEIISDSETIISSLNGLQEEAEDEND